MRNFLTRFPFWFFVAFLSLVAVATVVAAYRDVGWLPVFWTAVLQAQREEKPILLWAMNGHPLACT